MEVDLGLGWGVATLSEMAEVTVGQGRRVKLVVAVDFHHGTGGGKKWK